MSIKKIAEMVGVSHSTVSRILNNPSYKGASKELRDRILEAAREINYIPNEAARNLRLGVEKNSPIHHIGILVTNTNSTDVDPFHDELLRIVIGEIHRNMCILTKVWFRPTFLNSEVMYLNQNADADKAIEEMYHSAEHESDGIVVIGKCGLTLINGLKKYFKNVVSINRSAANYEIDEVMCSGQKIAEIAIEHLIKLGHRRIGYVGECHDDSYFKGYKNVLFKYNLDYDLSHIIETSRSEENGYRIMGEIAKLKLPPTGIYCSGDILAIGMLKYLNSKRSNYYTPSIISSDDIDEAQFSRPMLTTVRVPKEEMAKFALYLLIDRINGGHSSVSCMEVNGTLIVRDSCSSVNNALSVDYCI